MRSAVVSARRQVIERCHAACSSHNTGAGAIIASAVALGEPTVKMTNAKMAAIAPFRTRRGTDRQADQPAHRCPRQEHQRCSREVGQDVGRQLVDERRRQRARRGQPEMTGGPPNTETSEQQQRGDPQPVGDPVGHRSCSNSQYQGPDGHR